MKYILAALIGVAFVLSGCVTPVNGAGDGSATDTSETTYHTTPTESEVTRTTAAQSATDTEPPPVRDETADFIDALLDSMLDGINDAHEFAGKIGWTDSRPDEFNSIVALGEAALPYLEKITKNTEFSNYFRSMTATFARHAIKPELFDIVFPSRDGKYEVRASISYFSIIGYSAGGDMYNDIRLIDLKNGEVMVSLDKGFVNIYAEWSPDGRYAAVSYSVGLYGTIATTTVVFDTLYGICIKLPGEKEVRSILCDKFDHREGFLFPHFYFKGWEKTDVIQIQVDMDYEWNVHAINGWYWYDLSKREIIDMGFEVFDPPY